MSRLPASVFDFVPQDDTLEIQTSGGQTLRLRPNPALSNLSPEAKAVLLGAAPSGDLPVIEDARGVRLGGAAGARGGAAIGPGGLSLDELVELGATEIDPSTGQYVVGGTSNPRTATRGVNPRIPQRILMQSVEQRRNMRKAGKDAEAIQQLITDGADQEAVMKAIADIGPRNNLGANDLIQIPAYRELTGQQSQFQQIQQAEVLARSQQSGLPPETYTRDANGNLQIDPLAANEMVLKDRKNKDLVEMIALQEEMNNDQSQQEAKRIRDYYRPVIDDKRRPVDDRNNANNQMNIGLNRVRAERKAQQEKALRQLLKINGIEMGPEGPAFVGPEQAAIAAEPAAPAPAPAPLTHPKVPGATIASAFGTPQEFAMELSKLPREKYYTVGNVVVYLGADGKPQEIN